jgi:hypothetical protein
MTEKPARRPALYGDKWKRMLTGAASSLGVFILTRILAGAVYPLDKYPLPNQLLFLGTPYLAIGILFPAISVLGLAGAYIINAFCWIILGAAISGLVRKPLMAVAAWMGVAALGGGFIFACLILGMMSGSP